jgi:Phage integrase, N-terminal SAM-like domain
MAHIEKRVRNGRVTYRARYRDPAGREHGKVFARKLDAQRFLTEMENAKLRGRWTSPSLGRVLFRDWLTEWRRTTASLRPNTEARDEWLLRLHVLPRFGPMPLAKIGQHDVRAWVAELGTRGLAPSTVQRAYQLLSKVMAAAADAGMIPRTPCRRVPLPKIDRQEMRFLGPQEVARLPPRSGRTTAHSFCSAPTAGSASAKWPGCAAAVWTWPRALCKWSRSSPSRSASSTSGRRRSGRPVARSDSPSSWSRRWPSAWARRAAPRTSCSPAPRVVCCGLRPPPAALVAGWWPARLQGGRDRVRTCDLVVVSDTRYHCATRPCLPFPQLSGLAPSSAPISVTRPRCGRWSTMVDLGPGST